MSATVSSESRSTETTSNPAETLRQSFSAMRVSFSWFGVRRSLSPDQCQQAAAQFGAEKTYISAGKKLIDTSHPAMRAVNQLRREIGDYWKNSSLPFPEPGIRLVRQAELERLNGQMELFRHQLAVSVSQLQVCYDEIKQQAHDRLGSLYCDSDYPASFLGLFEVAWDFPNVEPPDYLRRLQPELYEQECKRMRSRFEEAAMLAEQAFMDELAGLVSHLGDRLSGADDGKPKIFRDSAIDNLHEFFERFQRLNIHSSDELENLVTRAQSLISGVLPQQLRDSNGLRQQLATQLSSVQSVLDGLMVDRPRRRILRG